MMNDPEGKIYQQHYKKLNEFEKNLKDGPLFEKSMRKVFDEFVLWVGICVQRRRAWKKYYLFC